MDGSTLLFLVAMIGVDYGWQAQSDGSLEYIIQLEPETVNALMSGETISSEIPSDVYGVRKFRIQVGNEALPQDAGNFNPADAAPTSQYQPIVVGEPSYSVSNIDYPAWQDNAAAAPALVQPQTQPSAVVGHPQANPSFPQVNSTVPQQRASSIRQPNSATASYRRLPYRREARDAGGVESPPDPHQDENLYEESRIVSDEPSRWQMEQERRRQDDRMHSGRDLAGRSPSDSRWEDPEADRESLRVARSDRRRAPPLNISAEDHRRLVSRESSNESDLAFRDEAQGDSNHRDGRQRSYEHDPELRYTHERESRFADDRRPDASGRDDSPRDSREIHGDARDDDVERSKGGTWPMTLLGLFASIAANAYMGWVTWSAVHRYRDLVDDVRRVET